jgi:hypothetical protein
VTAIADVTCGYTALTILPEGQEVLTAEVKINLLRPVLSKKNYHRRLYCKSRADVGHYRGGGPGRRERKTAGQNAWHHGPIPYFVKTRIRIIGSGYR